MKNLHSRLNKLEKDISPEHEILVVRQHHSDPNIYLSGVSGGEQVIYTVEEIDNISKSDRNMTLIRFIYGESKS